jgi:uncharacterized membrane protein
MLDPGFMRTEVWHALSVHFPITLIIFSTLTMLVSLFLTGGKRDYWRYAASGLLFAGCLTSWVAVYTGNLADGVVARKICDPTILKDHEITARTMTYLVTLASIICITQYLKVLTPGFRKIAYWLTIVVMLIGSVYLIRAGHLGASLVYEQGAAVKNHSVDCID